MKSISEIMANLKSKHGNIFDSRNILGNPSQMNALRQDVGTSLPEPFPFDGEYSAMGGDKSPEREKPEDWREIMKNENREFFGKIGGESQQTNVEAGVPGWSMPEEGSFTDKLSRVAVPAITHAFPIVKATDDPAQMAALKEYGVNPVVTPTDALSGLSPFFGPMAPAAKILGLALRPVERHFLPSVEEEPTNPAVSATPLDKAMMDAVAALDSMSNLGGMLSGSPLEGAGSLGGGGLGGGLGGLGGGLGGLGGGLGGGTIGSPLDGAASLGGPAVGPLDGVGSLGPGISDDDGEDD